MNWACCSWTFPVLSRDQPFMLRVRRLGAGCSKVFASQLSPDEITRHLGDLSESFRSLFCTKKWYQISYSGNTDHLRSECASPFYFLVFFIMSPCPRERVIPVYEYSCNTMKGPDFCSVPTTLLYCWWLLSSPNYSYQCLLPLSVYTFHVNQEK